jgi:hypothetical protein
MIVFLEKGPVQSMEDTNIQKDIELINALVVLLKQNYALIAGNKSNLAIL